MALQQGCQHWLLRPQVLLLRWATPCCACSQPFLSTVCPGLSLLQEAHEKLHAALLSLDSSLDLGSIEEDAAAAAAAGGSGSGTTQAQAQVQQAGPDGELYIRCDRGNAVHSLGLIDTGVPGSKPNLWVGLKWSTDFYPGCSSARKESESVVRVRP